ncbi:MAG: hypothetical protein L6R42_011538, partial [Xanthoria sp. 1 TBL-2021]
MPQSPRHPPRERTALQDCGRQHGIGWGQTGTDNQGSGPVGPQDSIHKARSDQPTIGHDRHNHHAHTGPMAGKIGLGQVHTHTEYLQTHDYASGFLRD